MLSGLSGLSGLSSAAAGPTAPAGAVFAAVAHPSCCRSDAACTVPCAAGDAIRWWQELVTGTWYEQATSGFRPVMRSAGGGKWYAEGDFASGRFFRFGVGIARPTEIAVAGRSQSASFDTSYSGFVNGYGGIPQRWCLTSGGGTGLYYDPAPRAAWRNGAAITPAHGSLVPITDWMRLQIRIASGLATPADVLLWTYDTASYTGALDISAVCVFASDRTPTEQVGDRSWLAEYTP